MFTARHTFMLAAAIGVTLTTPAVAEPGDDSEGRPNFVILFTDDQRFDTIHALGGEQISSPNMDRLVREGVSFTNTYVMGSIHGAVCMPSRAMLLTGRHLHDLPISVTSTWSVPPEERGACPYTTFPEVFREAGYETFVTGKWHNGAPLLARGFTNGANIFFGGMSDHLAVPVHDFDPTGTYDAKASKETTFSSELFADSVITFLRDRDQTRPFLAYVPFTAPHDPRMAPEAYTDLYDSATIAMPESFAPEHPYPTPDLRVRDEKLAPFPRTETVVQEHIAAYYAMISHLDAQIGRVLDALDETGLRENTYIILAGDNGLAVGQHGLLGKQNLYEHSSRVPLIIAGPGIPKDTRFEGLCYLHDVAPTICALAGLPIPESVQATSLLPMIHDGDVGRDAVFCSYSKGHQAPTRYIRSVRHGEWKLIETHFDGIVTTTLYNLHDDPHEICSLASDPAQTDIIDAMRDRLRALAVQYNDPMRARP